MRNRAPKASYKGFTLGELLATMAIMAILLSVGVPTFEGVIRSNRLTTGAWQLAGALQLARSEAVKRILDVSVCKSADGSSCDASTTTFWEEGWLVFVDNDSDGTVDVGDEILQKYPVLAGGYTLRTSTAAMNNYLRYSSNGRSNVTGNFYLCPSSSNSTRLIEIEGTGSIAIEQDTAVCP